MNVKAKLVVVTGKWGPGDGYKHQVDEYCRRVEETGFFERDNIFCYSESPEYVLQDERFSRHLWYRSDPNDMSVRGAGYWFQKSVTVRHHMDLIEDGALIIWADVDRIDFFRQGTFNALLETMERRGADFSIEHQGGLENGWTKEDALRAFNATPSMRETKQVNANAWVVRNSASMRKFLDAVIECVADWHMVSDDPSVFPNRRE